MFHFENSRIIKANGNPRKYTQNWNISRQNKFIFARPFESSVGSYVWLSDMLPNVSKLTRKIFDSVKLQLPNTDLKIRAFTQRTKA